MSAPSNAPDCIAQVRMRLWETAEAVDDAARFPFDEIALLGDAGLLAAALPGGALNRLPIQDVDALRGALTAVGSASLTVGRLFEGHVNAAALLRAYGGPGAAAILADEVACGRLSGVWNAERGGGVTATRNGGGWTIEGTKVFCSGAGAVRRPVVTVRCEGDLVLMMLPDMTGPGVTVDVSRWRAAGMRGTATGTVRFDRAFVPDEAVIGAPGDYYRTPLFSGGAWRVLAVQFGGLQRILELHAEALTRSGRSDDPVIRARFADAAAGYELARLLVAEAARRTSLPEAGTDVIDAYVDQARGQFETLALAGIEAARRNVGLDAFIAPHPLDRTTRDLETYLRQPFLDASRDAAARWLLPRGGRFPT